MLGLDFLGCDTEKGVIYKRLSQDREEVMLAAPLSRTQYTTQSHQEVLPLEQAEGTGMHKGL